MLDKNTQSEIIGKGRDFMKGYRDGDPNMDAFESDQQLRLPQPPLAKPARSADGHIALTKDFSSLVLKNDAIALFRDRRSARVYTGKKMSTDELSFLLWATQGIKEIRGKSYATLRTVPSGGARHEYETYLLVLNVEGLEHGVYHYLPFEHALEFFGSVDDGEKTADDLLCGQNWAAKANVIFFWAMNAYRAEWRYGIYAHRPALIDAGHIGQNLYLSCTALGLGTCGIAAFSHDECCRVFGLDGEDEFVVYCAPVGTIRDEDKTEEAAFYQFVEDEGL